MEQCADARGSQAWATHEPTLAGATPDTHGPTLRRYHQFL